MENYDSEESKEDAKLMGKLLKKINLSDEMKEKLTKEICDLSENIQIYLKLKKDGRLTVEEDQTFKKVLLGTQDALQLIADVELLIGSQQFNKSEQLMELFKKEGEGGNEEAQKIYTDLYKNWLEAGNEDRGMN